MTKSFFLSIMIHLIMIALIMIYFQEKPHKTVLKQTKKISLKHIVLKEIKPKPQEEKQHKEEKKEKEKPKIKQTKPIKKHIIKTKPKPKKKIQKKKRFKKKRVRKRVQQKRVTKSRQEFSTLPVQTPRQDYLLINKNKIYEAIQRAKRYPRMAKKLHIQGTVKIKFKLHTNGEVTNITTSNAHKILQKSAVNTIKEASVEFPKPNKTVNIVLNIEYKLR